MSKNYYPQLFSELERKDVTAEAIVSWLCKHQPFAVIRAIRAAREIKDHPIRLDNECRKILGNKGKFHAIKYVRGETGISLKEAVSYIESLK